MLAALVKDRHHHDQLYDRAPRGIDRIIVTVDVEKSTIQDLDNGTQRDDRRK